MAEGATLILGSCQVLQTHTKGPSFKWSTCSTCINKCSNTALNPWNKMSCYSAPHFILFRPFASFTHVGQLWKVRSGWVSPVNRCCLLPGCSQSWGWTSWPHPPHSSPGWYEWRRGSSNLTNRKIYGELETGHKLYYFDYPGTCWTAISCEILYLWAPSILKPSLTY